jgi:hypothetical protein
MTILSYTELVLLFITPCNTTGKYYINSIQYNSKPESEGEKYKSVMNSVSICGSQRKHPEIIMGYQGVAMVSRNKDTFSLRLTHARGF